MPIFGPMSPFNALVQSLDSATPLCLDDRDDSDMTCFSQKITMEVTQ